MRVPNSFNKITVSQYQEIAPLLKSLSSEEDSEKVMTLWANILAVLTDKQTDYIEELPLWKLNHYIKQAAWINNPETKGKVRKYIIVKGRMYKASLEMQDFSTSKYIEISTWLKRSKGETVPEIHNLMASIYSPLTWKGFKHDGRNHAKHAQRFKSLKMGRVYPTVFFYSNVWANSIINIAHYGEDQLNKANKILRQSWEAILQEISELDGVGTSQ